VINPSNGTEPEQQSAKQHEGRNQVAGQTLNPDVGDNRKRSLLGHQYLAGAENNEKPAPERACSPPYPERTPCISEGLAEGGASRALLSSPIGRASAIGDHG